MHAPPGVNRDKLGVCKDPGGNWGRMAKAGGEGPGTAEQIIYWGGGALTRFLNFFACGRVGVLHLVMVE